MGGGGGDGGAAQARADEQARQAKIREGTAAVNKIFDGGKTATGKIGGGAAYDPNATYYNEDGSVWTPTAFSDAVRRGLYTGKGWSGTVNQGTNNPYAGTGKLGADAVYQPGAKYYNADGSAWTDTTGAQFNAARAKGLFSGMADAPGQFNDEFFNKRQQAYLDYATPQLDDQYADAQKALAFSLARSGNSDSSVRAEKLGELQKLYDTNKQQVADQARAYSNQSRTAVEDARTNLIQTLNATGDAQGAANSALARASALASPDAYSPLGQLFSTFTSALGQQAALERASAYSGGAVKPRYNTGLFGGNPNAVSVS